MAIARRPRLRTILLIAMIPVVALIVGMGVGVISLVADSASSTGDRMTHEQLLVAAAGPDAADHYDYYFSSEELASITPHIKPWNCVPGKELSDADQYHCGVDAIFIPDTLNFVPDGYMYQGALMNTVSHKLAGIRIVREAKVSSGVKHA